MADRRWARFQLRSAVVPFAAALIVLVFGGVSYWTVTIEERDVGVVLQAQQVIARNRDMLTRLLDAEAAERDYLISGDSTFLRRYRGADAAVKVRLDQLDAIVHEDSPQQTRLDSVRSLIGGRFRALDARITERKTQGFAAARNALIHGGSSHEVFDSLRQIVADVEADEGALLGRREQQLRAAQATVLWTVGLGTVAATILGLFITLKLSRYAASVAEANESKAKFLAQVSHDLRTPLNAIMGYDDIMRLGIHGAVTEQQSGDLDRITAASSHLLSLINHVLHFAKIEAGQLAYELQPVTVADVFEDVEAIILPQAQEKGLRLSIARQSGSAQVLADRARAGEILANLLVNAIKFTPPDGSIDVSCDIDDGSAYLRVRDSGPGIPADRQANVFLPFVQLGTPTSATYRGAGLGLAISREMARSMGGDLTLASRHGSGSTFTLRLPLAIQSAARS